MNKNILIVTPDFNYCCGRSKHVFSLIKYFEQNDYNVIFLSNRGDSFSRLDSYLVKIIIIPNLFSKKIHHIFKNIIILKDIFKKNNINIIHSHHRFSDFLVSLTLFFTNLKINTVTTEHSILKRKLFLNYYSKDLIAVSKVVKDNLINNYNISEERVSLIPNFISVSNYNLKNAHTRDGSIKILSAGRFVEDKNYDLILYSVNYLSDKNKILITLIGEGEKKHELKNLADKLTINIRFLPVQPDISKYISDSDICILTSKIEAFPTFMLEAGLFKKPFIGSDISGINGLIKDRHNGLLFKQGNAKNLSEKIKLFIENPDLAKKCSVNLNEDVMNQFTEEKIIPKVLKLYEKI